MPGFGVAKSPQGRAVRRPARLNIFGNAKLAAVLLNARSHARARSRGPAGEAAPLLWERSLAHCAGMTLQFVRPDIRQSCILLAAVRS